jgi:hypothetical protein
MPTAAVLMTPRLPCVQGLGTREERPDTVAIRASIAINFL